MCHANVHLSQAKDHMNHRFLHKRAFYLATVAAALKKHAMFSSLTFEAEDGNPLRPVLSVRPVDPTGADKTKFCIRIHPCIAESVFKIQKLAPNRNNMRRHKSEALLPEGTAEAGEAAEETATPRYNQCILQDMFFGDHLKVLHRYFSDPACTGLSDACLLLKVCMFGGGGGCLCVEIEREKLESECVCVCKCSSVCSYSKDLAASARHGMRCLWHHEWLRGQHADCAPDPEPPSECVSNDH